MFYVMSEVDWAMDRIGEEHSVSNAIYCIDERKMFNPFFTAVFCVWDHCDLSQSERMPSFLHTLRGVPSIGTLTGQRAGRGGGFGGGGFGGGQQT